MSYNGGSYGGGNPNFATRNPQSYASPYDKSHEPSNRSYPTQNTSTKFIGPDPETQQSRLLADATRRVQEQAYYMRRAIDNDDLPTTLERAASMLSELGSGDNSSSSSPGGHSSSSSGSSGGSLTPRNYYELHMRTLDEMPNLEEFLLSLGGDGEDDEIETMNAAPTVPKFRQKELYEIVQYCPRVVPRLYLQICAASALIRSGEAGTKVVFNELVEVVKSVQCPLRGLFLRSYLLQALKDKLPDVASFYDIAPGSTKMVDFLDDDMGLGEMNDPSSTAIVPFLGEADAAKMGGNLEDSYTFVLENFVEMNKLWCRIHHVPGERGNREMRKKRDKERHELRILVGTNLVRLSQLDGITPQIYKDTILPQILEQISTCNDALAQAYLMDCVIQVFPDEFHLYTLSDFLSVCPKLKEKVNIRTILHAMMERLTNYAKGTGSGDEAAHIITLDAFKMFEECIQSTCTAKGANLAPKEVIRMETALLNFSLKCYPGKLEHVNSCLGVCAKSLAAVQRARDSSDSKRLLDDEAVEELEKLLSIPLESLHLRVLELDHYSHLLKFLPWENWRQVGTVMLRSVNSSSKKLESLSQIEELFNIMAPLLRDQNINVPRGGDDDTIPINIDDTMPLVDPESLEFKSEQTLVARLVHLFSHEDTDQLYKMMAVARKHFVYGGAYRMQHTIPPLVFATIPLIHAIHKSEFEAPPEMPDVPPPPAPPEVDLIDIGGNTDATQQEEQLAIVPVAEPTPEEKRKAALNDLLSSMQGGDTSAEETKTPAEPELTFDPVAPPPAADIQKEVNKSTSLLLDLGVFDGNKPEDNVGDNSDKLFQDDVDEPNNPASSDPTDSSPLFTKLISSRKVFVFLQKLISAFAPHCPELAFKLDLELCLTASSISKSTPETPVASQATPAEYNAIAYEFMTQAFTIYEDSISDSKAQSRAITAMIGTLLTTRTFEKSDYESLITKTAQYGAKLLKKPDQCKMVTLCSHLFFTTAADEESNYKNPQRVLECLQRSLKIADACSMASPASVNLFVEILDHYVYYFEAENPLITHKFVSGLIALISEHLGGIGGDQTGQAANYFREIVRYLNYKKTQADTAEKFAPINC